MYFGNHTTKMTCSNTENHKMKCPWR